MQANPDLCKVPIAKVGVQKIRLPIAVRDLRKTAQHTVGSVDMSVDLPSHFGGTHMSRFMEIRPPMTARFRSRPCRPFCEL